MNASIRRVLLLLALSLQQAHAQPPSLSLQTAVQTVTGEQFRAHIDALGTLVQACRASSAACNPASVGNDDKVVADGETYQVRWQWLRAALAEAHSSSSIKRDDLLDQCTARLNEELADLAAPLAPAIQFAPARRDADSILSRSEFRIVHADSWLDREKAKFWAWFYRFFTAAADFSQHAPWLGHLLEWSFIGITFTLALVWLVRSYRRERLSLSLHGAMPSVGQRRESQDWSALARIEAENGDWRAAIHCLYWASIVELEGRRLWRRDPARTPREYISLLDPASGQRSSLRAMTLLFERVWYGIRAATQEDYAQALLLFQELSAR